ncbi:MAG: hypothetical protein GEV03_06835 [Streptosporangiales bacterium]|nr:hypothetical protein [Streptosporangiales bacterium]
MRIALGFRPHTTWTVAVAVGDPGTSVVERRRIELGDPSLPDQVYHAARELDIEAAADLVRRAEGAVAATAAHGLGEFVADLRAGGHEVTAAGLPTAGAHLPESLGKILASHALLHAAEGDLVRGALIEAASGQGLTVYRAAARDLVAHACAALGYDERTLGRMLDDLGRAIGPPWRRDEKDATLAAWLALKSADR